jgi:hypothetical protein
VVVLGVTEPVEILEDFVFGVSGDDVTSVVVRVSCCCAQPNSVLTA